MLVDILEEQLDEVVDLFERRRQACRFLDLTADDLTEIDRRLKANVDGLLLGPDEAWRLCHRFFDKAETGESFAAATLALATEHEDAVAALEEACGTASGPVAVGIVGAGCLTESSRVIEFLGRQAARSEPSARSIGLAGLVHRRLESSIRHFESALRDDPGPWLAAGLHGVGVFRQRSQLRAVEALACSDDASVAETALESLVLLDPVLARRRCIELLAAGGSTAYAAAGLLGVVGRSEDVRRLAQVASTDDRDLARAAILALGYFGDAEAVPTLSSLLRDDTSAGVATAALRSMLGEALPDVEQPGAGVASRDESDESPWHPDDDLPRLHAEAVVEWWEENRSKFQPGARFHRGEKRRPDARDGEDPLVYQWLSLLEASVANPDDTVAKTFWVPGSPRLVPQPDHSPDS